MSENIRGEYDVLVYQGDKLLARLHQVTAHDGANLLWSEYEPELISISEEAFAAELDLRKDPRDIPWIFNFVEDNKEIPFHHFMVAWRAKERRVRIKYDGPVVLPPPTVWSRIRRFFGIRSQIERLVGQRPCDARFRAQIEAQLASHDEDQVCDAMWMNYKRVDCPKDWLYSIYSGRLRDPRAIVRLLAASGIDGLARDGYQIAPSEATLLTEMLNDPSTGVRLAATKALDVIKRFAKESRSPGR